MLSSITPLGERGRNNRWWLTATAFVVGSFAGGSLMGVTAAALGRLIDFTPSTALAVASGAALIALMLELRLGGLRLPTTRRQVNENWLQRYRGWVYGLGFGFQLGTGVLTIMTTAAVPLTFVVAGLTRSVVAGAAVGGVFGLARGLMVLPARRIRDAEGLVNLHRRIAATAGTAARATTGVLAGVGLICAIGAIT